MKTKLLSIIALALLSTGLKSQSITRLLGCGNQQNTLWVMDTSNFNVVNSQTIPDIGGMSIDGITGLAKHPVTGAYYIVAKANGSRHLGILNPATATVSNIGDLNCNVGQITFNGNNSLIGINGSSGNDALAITRINPANANYTVMDVASGNYGQVICYNPNGNKIYHLYDYDDTFEKLDTIAPFTPTFITNPNGIEEAAGMAHRSAGMFITCNLSQSLNYIDTLGNVTNAGSAPAILKGLAYITCPRLISGTYTFCAGGSATLNMSAGGVAYQWFKNNLAVTGATLAQLTTTASGHYNCRITDGCGIDSLATGVTVAQQSLPIVNITGSTSVCSSGQTITLTGSGGGSSQWYQNGVAIPGATVNTLGVSAPGVYNMIKTNLNGCADSASVGKTVTVTASPTVNIAAFSTTLCSGQTTTLTGSGNAHTFSWTTGPTTTSLAVSPTITTTYYLIGTSTVTGCSKTSSITITVSLCNGIVDIADNKVSVRVSPNPTKGMITLEANTEISQYEILDLTGKVIVREKISPSTKATFNLSNFEDSIYFIKISTTDGKVVQSKIILSK